VDKALRAAVARVATAATAAVRGGVQGGLFDGRLAPEKPFDYLDNSYVLWVAEQADPVRGKVATVKVARRTAAGYRLVGVLTAASFDDTLRSDPAVPPTAHFNALVRAARLLQDAAKRDPRQPPNQNTLPTLQQRQREVTAAENALVQDIQADACTLLNAGCFGAGTLLLTREGWRAVETIQPGDWVLARHEDDPHGKAEWKQVEKRFERTAFLLHLHVGGEVIRTTAEHRFYAHGKGWSPAAALAAGDWVSTLAGGWVAVEEAYETGEYATVYNLRVADYHTYFVGAEGWGFGVWAHNHYRLLADVLQAAPEVADTARQTLERLAKDRIPHGEKARQSSLAAFRALLEKRLTFNRLLANGKHLSDETAVAAKEAAEVHGNAGRKPTILIDPTAPNPFTAGTLASDQWEAIQALHNANPGVQALRLRDQLPGGTRYARGAGLPYHLLRARAYANNNELVEVERPVGNGECDLVLTGNRLVDCKAWSPRMWSLAGPGKRLGMMDQIAGHIANYLGDPAGYTLRFEFRYDIPPEILGVLRTEAAQPQFQGRLTWAANVT
jgi:hypothetical protein